MAKRVQRRRGTTAEHSTFTGADGEITVDTTKDTAIIHDGAQAGGYPLAREDLSNVTNKVGIQQLNLSDGSAGQVLKTDGSGTLSFTTIDAGSTAVGGDLTGTVSNAQIGANKVGIAELNLSDGSAGQVIKTDGSGTLSFTSVSSDPAVGGDISGTASNAQIVANAVTATELASDAVTTAKILNANVTTAKIADDAVTEAKIAAQTITNASILPGTIRSQEIENGTITGTDIADNSISGSQIALGGDAQGDIMHYDGTNWVRLGPATAGHLLQTQGSGQNPSWVAPPVPTGVIVMWSGTTSNIPTGWVLCDGQNSTPDLRDRFIVGAGSTYNAAATGGSTSTGSHTLTVAELPAHSHTFSYTAPNQQTPAAPHNLANNVGSAGTVNTGTNNTGDGAAHTHANSLPPYLALAYIMKT